MNRYFTAFWVTVVSLLALGKAGLAQTPTATPPQTTIKLHVVLSKYQGDKSISSQPYTLSLLPKERGNLRIGSEVPIRTTASTAPSGAPGGQSPPTNYVMQSVGTTIDATVTPTTDGKYQLDLTINDRSVYTGPQVAQTAERVPNVPVFRNVNSSSKAILSNGETMQFTTAIDQVSNETFKVDVTLNVGNK